MKYSQMTDAQVEMEMKSAVQKETNATTRVLHLLAEVERRRIYSKDHPSLFEYCVKVLKYSGGAAQRRIDTMRAMKLIPEIEQKLVTGELNCTTVSQAQSFFRQEAKQHKPYSIEDKRELLKKLENKSTRECVATLVEISPEAIPQEKRRALTFDKTELKLALDNDVIEVLDQIKSLLSRNRNLSDSDLIKEMAYFVRKHLDPSQKKERKKGEAKKQKPIQTVSGPKPNRPEPKPTGLKSKPTNPESKAKTLSRYIPVSVKRAVWIRDQGRCVYKNCGSSKFLQYDHVTPVVMNGEATVDNLRLVCQTHNQRAAIDKFGFKFMDRFINSKCSQTSGAGMGLPNS